MLEIGKPDSIIYTNIGTCKEADDKLLAVGGQKYFEPDFIIVQSHARGADELIHPSIKELATKEQTPYKSFGMNRAYDVTGYSGDADPDTFRNKLIDFAVKLISRSIFIILNVTKTIFSIIKMTCHGKNANRHH